MKTLLVVLTLSVCAVAGCGKDSSKKSASGAAAAGGMASRIVQMSKSRDDACACKDAACAKRVSDDMIKGMQEEGESAPATPEETQKLTEISTALITCLDAARGVAPSP